MRVHSADSEFEWRRARRRSMKLHNEDDGRSRSLAASLYALQRPPLHPRLLASSRPRSAMSKSSSNTSASDAALAAKLQAEEDAVLAQRLEDERLALAHDPWQQAEAEWDNAMKQHDANSGAKVAKEIHAQEAHALKLKAQREEEDRKLAQQIAANGTPVKGKK